MGKRTTPVRIERPEYASQIDTVAGVVGTRITQTGYSRQRIIPSVALSYYLLPTRGKVFSAQADADMWRESSLGAKVGAWARQAGLAVTLGLGLDKPTERLFLGLTTEPVPGITTSVGVQHVYRQRLNVPLDSGTVFVPKLPASTPLTNAWHKPRFAVSVGLEPQVVLSAFGKLVGLK